MSSALPDEPPLTVGSMLRRAWTELINQNVKSLHSAGLGDLRPSHQPILRDMLTMHMRPSELAAHLNLSKQAVNDLVREFEAMGYITLEPDPDDRRAKRIVATERGRKTDELSRRSSNAVGRRWAKQVGEERYAVFEEVLREIVGAQGRLSLLGAGHPYNYFFPPPSEPVAVVPRYWPAAAKFAV